MCKRILVLITFGLCACGQQTGSKQTQSRETKPQTHATATSQKEQIVQPAVKPGKNADASSLLISFHGCADLLLIDPRGRKLGYDSASQKNYLDIPGGIYDEGDMISDDEDDAKPQGQEKTARKEPDCIADKTVQFPSPVPGMYTLKVADNRAAAFKLEITSYGPDANANGHYVLTQPAGSASSAAYQFQLPPSPELQVKAFAK
ncbi:MAG TPA: hypothetical protein VE133_16070 [Candidatus Sulfotelmatobacter sp.]|nr:hypothetical protein [Candidatus Sulfotelmatobacter sp.]